MNNGPIYNRMAEEYEVWLDGEFVTWASDMIVANRLYNQALHQKCEHMRKEQNAWEWFTLATPATEIIEALDLAIHNTEPLQPFKVQDGLNIVCSYCEQEAKKQDRPLGYEPKEASHGVCPKHFDEQMELLERWVAEQKNEVIKVP